MVSIPAAFLLMLLVQAPGGAPQGAIAPALAEARAHYNAGRPAEALALVRPLLTGPGAPASAALVAARALLERYRASGDASELASAREHLRAMDASALDAVERREMVIGLAEALYLEDAFAPAAELFDAALSGGDRLDPAARERVLDWWATALDRHAQLKPAGERRIVYQRIADRMERESRDDPRSTPAAYWLAAGARGAGELDRAWAAAIAAWVRAPMTLDRGAALRADIDRLVVQALIPERARALGLPAKELEPAQSAMLAEWDLIKKNWSR